MNKIIGYIVFLSVILTGCNYSNQNNDDLQSQIDSLKSMMYKPGFGDFMSSIQNHHEKLWFAGINENWVLASFEIHELEELFEDIETIHPNRKETEFLSIIYPALEKVEETIEDQNQEMFKLEFTLLTNSCNSCHKSTDNEFIKIKVPETSSFSNQEFRKR